MFTSLQITKKYPTFHYLSLAFLDITNPYRPLCIRFSFTEKKSFLPRPKKNQAKFLTPMETETSNQIDPQIVSDASSALNSPSSTFGIHLKYSQT